MAQMTWPDVSPRHGFKYDRVPTVRGSMYGGGVTPIRHLDYGPVLDCIFEMADDIMTGNGISAAQAVDLVCKDERWRILPRHRKAIIARLSAA